jgi:predicted nucleic acid-binding protein
LVFGTVALNTYIETTIVSYLTARPSRDLVIRAHQRLTREWWRDRRAGFSLHISPLVLQEAGMGDRRVARRRLRALQGIPILRVTPEAVSLGQRLIRQGPIPEKAEVDALHIATAAVHGMEYLITWNCRHIANAMMRSRLEALCRLAGYEPPIMCTPEELAGE